MSQNFAGRRRRKRPEGGASQRSSTSEAGGSDKIIVDQDAGGGDEQTPSTDTLAAGPDESTALIQSPLPAPDHVPLDAEGGDADENTAHVKPLPPPARLARPADPVAVSPALAYADESDVGPVADEGQAYGAHYGEAHHGAYTQASSGNDSLIDMLSHPVAESLNPLENVMAAPGEVPALHSNAGLYSMWTFIALLVAGGIAFGVWAVFFYQPL